MIDRNPSNAIYLATPNKLRNAMKEVLDIEDHFSNRGGSEKAEETKCSLCGDTYTGVNCQLICIMIVIPIRLQKPIIGFSGLKTEKLFRN